MPVLSGSSQQLCQIYVIVPRWTGCTQRHRESDVSSPPSTDDHRLSTLVLRLFLWGGRMHVRWSKTLWTGGRWGALKRKKPDLPIAIFAVWWSSLWG